MKSDSTIDLAAILDSAQTIQAHIMNLDERQCNALLAAELRGKRRKIPMLRIHSRINKLRAHRERAELIAKASS